MATLHVEIVTPRRFVWKGEANDVQAPGELGEFGVLPKHIPFLTTLRPGPLKVNTVGEGLKKWNSGTGFAEAGPDRVVILTESCEEGWGLSHERESPASAGFFRFRSGGCGCPAWCHIDVPTAAAGGTSWSGLPAAGASEPLRQTPHRSTRISVQKGQTATSRSSTAQTISPLVVRPQSRNGPELRLVKV